MRRSAQLARDVARGRYAGIHELFLVAGARPPSIIWNPSATNLRSRRLIALLSYWNGLRDSQAPPEAGRWSVESLGPLADYTMLIEAEDGGRDLVYRHYGRGIARHYGEDLTGLRISEIDGHVAVFAGSVYRAVMMRQEPAFTEHEPPRHVFVRHWQRVVLPLGDGRGGVSHLAVGSIPEDPIRAIIDTVIDGVLAVDEAGAIRILNPAVEALFGYAARELVGQPLATVLCWRHGPATDPSLVGRSSEALGRRRDGSEFPVEVSVGETSHGGGKLMVAVIRDITERKANEAEMRRLAYHDPLTGAANRALFEERFAEAIARARRDRSRIAVIILDLDHFKAVNDSYGHAVGDAVLCGITRRLAPIVRETDLLARLGGDEFAILLTGLRDAAGAATFAGRILARLDAPIAVAGLAHRVRASLGVAVWPAGGTTGEALLRWADEALYVAKGEGGHRFVVGGPAGHVRSRRKA
ncbi:MAG TPA: diguanylate cyclase [Geminicoccaceae bacterium]|nr:diguanylate cyclase [Geminicoccus sp.]HMU48175.1 diguanylate cyclase [Geminicoccaceae bacterium]